MLIKALEHANADQHNQLNSWINAETFQPAEKNCSCDGTV